MKICIHSSQFDARFHTVVSGPHVTQTDCESQCGATATTTSTTTTTTSTTTTTPGPGPATSANILQCANWSPSSVGTGFLTTVGSNGEESAYGTHDQAGNGLEWTEEIVSSYRVRRGCSFESNRACDQSFTPSLGPSLASDVTGFRIVSASDPVNPNNLPNFATVGDINNVAHTDEFGTYGNVNYVYQICKYKVTNCEYIEFLNAVASIDTYNLYDTTSLPNNLDDPYSGIVRSGSSGSYTYSAKLNMDNKPVILISWFSAARYCNWLHNGKPSGAQNNNSTEDGAYTLNGAVSGNNIVRNAGAKYSIPTADEWYKAAFYKGGSTNAGYWNYATQSNTPPTCITANETGDGPFVTGYECT